MQSRPAVSCRLHLRLSWVPPEVLRDMCCGPHRGPRRCRAAIEAKASLLATLSEVHTRNLPFDFFTNPLLSPLEASAPAAPPKATLIKSHEEAVGCRGVGTCEPSSQHFKSVSARNFPFCSRIFPARNSSDSSQASLHLLNLNPPKTCTRTFVWCAVTRTWQSERCPELSLDSNSPSTAPLCKHLSQLSIREPATRVVRGVTTEKSASRAKISRVSSSHERKGICRSAGFRRLLGGGC